MKTFPMRKILMKKIIKKNNKMFFINFFFYIQKVTNKYYQKKQRKAFKSERYKKLLEDEKQRLVEYIENFYFLNFYCLPQVTQKNKKFLNFYFYRLVLENKNILKCWKFYEYKKIGYYYYFFEFFTACPQFTQFSSTN